MDLVGAAFEAAAAMMQENPERVRLRDAIVSANAELRERELIKLAALASAVASALRDRGIPEPGASLAREDVERHCAQRLARFKVPTIVEFTDALPMTSIGKVEKHKLRALAAAGAAAS